MISDELQEQASLYVLGALDAAESHAFELELTKNAELETFVRQLRDTLAALAYSAPPVSPPAELESRILEQISRQATRTQVSIQRNLGISWLPWAIAAALAVCCGILALDRAKLQREAAAARSADSLAQVVVIPLATTPDAVAPSKGSVVWEQQHQTGVIKLSVMPPAGRGKDYQLWVVDAEHKDPISAGIIRMNPNGTAEWRFKPNDIANHIKAFAISVEREGGVPKKEGPIVMVGSV